MPTLKGLWKKEEKIIPDRKRAQELVVMAYTRFGHPPATSKLLPLLEPDERKACERGKFPYRRVRGRWHRYRGFILAGLAVGAQHFFGVLSDISPGYLFAGIVAFTFSKDTLTAIAEVVDSVSERVRILQICVARLNSGEPGGVDPLDLARAIHDLEGEGSVSTPEDENAWHLAGDVLDKATYEPTPAAVTIP